MSALLIALVGCSGPDRFPSPALVGRQLPPTFVWVTDPDRGYEVALPGWPAAVRAEDGELSQLSVTLGRAVVSVSLTSAVPAELLALPEPLVAEAGASRLEALGAPPGPGEAWSAVPAGRRWTYPQGELRAGVLRDRVVTLVAHGAGEGGAAFLDSFSAEPMPSTRVGLPGSARQVRCPARCGPSVFEGQGGLGGMVGIDRFRAVALHGSERTTEDAIALLVGDATLVKGGEVRTYRTGPDTLWVRAVESGDEVAAAAVLSTGEPAWASAFLASLR